MTSQQVNYVVSALVLVQLVVVLIGLYRITRLIIAGWKMGDRSMYRKALKTFLLTIAIFMGLAVIQFLVLLE